MRESTGGTGPPGASRSAIGSWTRNISRSGKTGISSRSSLRVNGPPLGDGTPLAAGSGPGALRSCSFSCSIPFPVLQDAPIRGHLRTQSARKTWYGGDTSQANGQGGYPPAMTAAQEDHGGAAPAGHPITHRYVQDGALRMHIAEAGQGPL